MADYTERVEGFQIRDVTYFGDPPVNAPIQFDVVKWKPEENPHLCDSFRKVNGKWVVEKKLITEYCYSVGTLKWNEHEKAFDFESVGIRWLEEKPSETVIDMILKFIEEKEKEIDMD